jgi:hypothetical protein
MKILLNPFIMCLPEGASVEAKINGIESDHPLSIAFTSWIITYGGYDMTITLDPRVDPESLSDFLSNQSKRTIRAKPISYGDISGYSHHEGGFWIWWLSFEKSTILISMNEYFAPHKSRNSLAAMQKVVESIHILTP